MLTCTATTTIDTEPLVGSMHTNAIPTAISATKLILAMLADPLATTVFAAVLLLSMRAHRAAATINTSLAPLQMHTLDSRHSEARAQLGRRIDSHNTPLFEPTS